MANFGNLGEWGKIGIAQGLFFGVLITILGTSLNVFIGNDSVLLVPLLLGFGVLVGLSIVMPIYYVFGRILTAFIGFKTSKPFWRVYQVSLTASGAIFLLLLFTGQSPDILQFVLLPIGTLIGTWVTEKIYGILRWNLPAS